MARWDLRTDKLAYGQWLVGRLYPEASGLSPDGRLLVYYARKGPRTFTAVSQPPYFTALAFWENTSPWTAGGFFPDNRRLVLGVKYKNPREAGELPDDFEVTDVWEYFWKGRQFTSCGSLEANPDLVADLREQAFERILPPEDASHWPSSVRRRGRSR